MTLVALDCYHAKKGEEEKKRGYVELESWKEWRRKEKNLEKEEEEEGAWC